MGEDRFKRSKDLPRSGCLNIENKYDCAFTPDDITLKLFDNESPDAIRLVCSRRDTFWRVLGGKDISTLQRSIWEQVGFALGIANNADKVEEVQKSVKSVGT